MLLDIFFNSKNKNQNILSLLFCYMLASLLKMNILPWQHTVLGVILLVVTLQTILYNIIMNYLTKFLLSNIYITSNIFDFVNNTVINILNVVLQLLHAILSISLG